MTAEKAPVKKKLPKFAEVKKPIIIGSTIAVLAIAGIIIGINLIDGDDDSISIGNNSALRGTNVTITAWVYWKGGSGDYDPIVTQSDASYNGYYLYIYPPFPHTKEEYCMMFLDNIGKPL